jgi:hypothetical protein
MTAGTTEMDSKAWISVFDLLCLCAYISLGERILPILSIKPDKLHALKLFTIQAPKTHLCQRSPAVHTE